MGIERASLFIYPTGDCFRRQKRAFIDGCPKKVLIREWQSLQTESLEVGKEVEHNSLPRIFPVDSAGAPTLDQQEKHLCNPVQYLGIPSEIIDFRVVECCIKVTL